MTNRREFLQAAAVTALPVAAGATMIGAVRTRGPGSCGVHSVVIDGRHAAARAVGACLVDSGADLHVLAEGDVTQLWLRHLGPVWARQPAAIAGLTARPALFCLEHLAWASGLRVVFHGEHIIHAGGQTQHTVLRGAREAACSAGDLECAGPLWPTVIADAIAAHRPADRAPVGPSDAGLSPPLPAGARLLTSWIIAAT